MLYKQTLLEFKRQKIKFGMLSTQSCVHGKHRQPIGIQLLLVIVSFVLCLADAQTLVQYVPAQPVSLRQLYAQGIATVTVSPENATCGTNGIEQLCSLVDPRFCHACQASKSTHAHPPHNILDIVNGTYWQSTTYGQVYPSPFIINITISLRKKTYILQGDVIIKFRTSVPNAMVLQKSNDGGATWLTYQYFSTDCAEDFNMAEANGPLGLDALCVNPHRQIDSQKGIVKFDLTGKITALAGNQVGFLFAELAKRGTLWEFLTVTDLRVMLVRPASSSLLSEQRSHYGIYSVDADLSCDCNLHGSYCAMSGASSQVLCNCLHNTVGQSCDQCQSGYRALPWQPGSYLPFPVGTANECRESLTSSNNTSSQPLSSMRDSGSTGPTLDPRPCTPDPCQGSGDCILENTAAGYRCSCHVGFAGYACEINLNPCRSNPCDEVEKTCISDRYNQYQCVLWSKINGTDALVATTAISPDTWLTGATLGIIIGSCVAIPLFCMWIVLVIWWTTWRKLHAYDNKYNIKYTEEAENKYSNSQYKMGNAKSWLVPDGRNSMRTHKLRDRWIIHESQLELGKLIYSGEFSYICEGMYKSKDRDSAVKVVVKLLRDEKDENSLNELQNEFEVLTGMGRHPNVVWLQGMCSRVLDESTQTCLVNEYVARGDMQRILRRGRSRRKDQPPYSPTPVDELISFACDIAQGMRHITLLKYVHRSLCAKNILITFNNKAKICDFGMGAVIPSPTDYVRYTEHRNKHMKRWMAYEALLEDMYSIKSDVWSFGIVLWEIVTLGGMPYHNIKTSDLYNELKDHNRMEWPHHCSPDMYDLMLRCWHRRPESRPSFDMLCTELKKMKPMAKKHLNLKEYTYQMYVPLKLQEDLVDSLENSTFV